MKKSNLFLALAAIAFAGAVAFASCEKEQAKETVSNPNPNSEPITQTSPVFDDDDFYYDYDGATMLFLPHVSDTIHVAIDTTAPADSLSAILDVLSNYGNVYRQSYVWRNSRYSAREYLVDVTNSNFKTSLFRADLSRFQYVRYISQEHDTLNDQGDPLRIWFNDMITIADAPDANAIANTLNNLGIAYTGIDTAFLNMHYVYVDKSESTINVSNRLAATGQFSFCNPHQVTIGGLIFNKKRVK